MSRIQTLELEEGRTGNIVVGDLMTLNAKHVEDYEEVWREPLRELCEEDSTMSWRFRKQLAERHALITKLTRLNTKGLPKA